MTTLSLWHGRRPYSAVNDEKNRLQNKQPAPAASPGPRLRGRTGRLPRPGDPPSWRLTPTRGKGSEAWGQLRNNQHRQVRVGETLGPGSAGSSAVTSPSAGNTCADSLYHGDRPCGAEGPTALVGHAAVRLWPKTSLGPLNPRLWCKCVMSKLNWGAGLNPAPLRYVGGQGQVTDAPFPHL